MSLRRGIEWPAQAEPQAEYADDLEPAYRRHDEDEFFAERQRSNPVWLQARLWFQRHYVPSKPCGADFFKRHLPLIDHLRHYNWRKDLIGDLVAGLTIGVMHIPIGMGYGLITTLPVVYGLYTSFFPVIIYSFLGTSKHISVGPFAIISLILAASLNTNFQRFAPYASVPAAASTALTATATGSTMPYDASSAFLSTITGTSTTTSAHAVTTAAATMSSLEVEQRLLVAITITFMVGIIQLVLGLLHIGMINTYLSDAIVGGLTTGAAFHILTSQIKHILGITVKSFMGPLLLPLTWIDVFTNIPKTNPAAVVATIISMIVLVVVKDHINERFAKKLPVPIPIELLVVIMGTVISYFGDLETKFHLKVVGPVPGGMPLPKLPIFSEMGSLIGDAFVLAIISFALSLSVARLFAKKHDYRVDPNQELLAYGTGNVFSSFFQANVLCVALSRTVLQSSCGGKTQLVGLVSSVIMLIVLLFIGPLFRALPLAVLASIVIVVLKKLYLQILDLRTLWRVDKFEMSVWIVTFLAVVIIDVAPGLLIGVVFSLFLLIARAQLASMVSLGKMNSSDTFERIDVYKRSRELPNTKILRFENSLFYANAWRFKKLVREMVPLTEHDKSARVHPEEGPHSSAKPQHLVLDCSAITLVDSSGVRALVKVVKEYSAAGVKVHVCAYKINMLKLLQRNDLLKGLDDDVLQMTVQDAVRCFNEAVEANRIETSTLPGRTILVGTDKKRRVLGGDDDDGGKNDTATYI